MASLSAAVYNVVRGARTTMKIAQLRVPTAALDLMQWRGQPTAQSVLMRAASTRTWTHRHPAQLLAPARNSVHKASKTPIVTLQRPAPSVLSDNTPLEACTTRTTRQRSASRACQGFTRRKALCQANAHAAHSAHSVDMSDCRDCVTGRWADSAGMDRCQNCSENTYRREADAGCQPCDGLGERCDDKGMAAPSAGPGFFVDDAAELEPRLAR